MPQRTRSLQDAVIAITGGSRGIGLATAEAFRREGATVAIGARDGERAAAAAAGIGAAAYPLDVTDRASFQTFWTNVEADLGPIDVLVNNAGVMLVGAFDTETDEASREQLDVNLLGTLNGMKVALPPMRARGKGHIINMVSAVGVVGLPGCATYSAAKHGVVGLSEAVRGEIRRDDVDLTIVLPLPARSELTAGLGDARFVSWLQPSDIAAAVVGAAKKPRYQVFVPRWTNPVNRFLGVLPQGLREWTGSLFKADQLLATTDTSARRDYEARAVTSRLASERGVQA